MERRFSTRLQQLMDDATVNPAVLRDMLPRLERFVEPFAALLATPEQGTHLHEYVAGLISDVGRKNAESIAYLHDQDRQPLQKFIGQIPWDHRPHLTELARQVGVEIGEPDGVIVFDPSGFAKKGTESVGVQRQWCGRLGKVENCQVGIYLGYVSRIEHALVDVRLYLPAEWARAKRRRKKCGVPPDICFQTRHELALEMLKDKGPLLPHAWIAGDDEMGRSSWFRQELRGMQERYLLAVPSNTLIRDAEAEPPPYRGHGRHPKVPFTRVDRWCAALPESAWETIEVRPGDKGPLVMQMVKRRVQAKAEQGGVGPEEILVVTRERQANGSVKHDYYLSNADAETPLEEFGRVANAEHRIEECLKRAKSEAGLAEYQVRTWEGWHHHQTLSLLATWFLTQETRRGKKLDAGDHRSADTLGHRAVAA
ncbi:MAG: IS701 family transposase [Planctomycetes bacterium]|nr:IS701 family transposase [Planctomycetota bacterium]